MEAKWRLLVGSMTFASYYSVVGLVGGNALSTGKIRFTPDGFGYLLKVQAFWGRFSHSVATGSQ